MGVNGTAVWQHDGHTANVTDERERSQDSLYLPLAWIIVVLLVSIFGNSLVLGSFFRDPRLKVIFNLFVVHLATADIIISFLVILALVDQLFQISLLGKWTFVCQLCAVFANAIPVEQLILVHVMCHDRHKALQRGMSYTRNSFHWHIEKLVLFLTWVVSLFGSFLMTDLMSSVKLFGYGYCKFPGRLLYMSYTSFLHFAMLVSLTVAVVLITWDFRKRRKGPRFERLSFEMEDISSFLVTCRASSGSLQHKQSSQSLVPRSPLQVFRNFVSFPSSELQHPTCSSNPDLSRALVMHEDVVKINTRHSQKPYPKHSSMLDNLPACSKAEISPGALRSNLHEFQSTDCQDKLSSVDLQEVLVSVSGLDKDDPRKCGDRYMMRELSHDQFKHKPALTSTVETRLHGDGRPYDTVHQLGKGPALHGTKDQCVQGLWPFHVESQYIDSGEVHSVESVAAKGEPVAKKPLVSKGRYEHNRESQVALENSDDADERIFAESVEDLLPASVSLSDNELVDFPQLHLRPRTDSLYTLRSCLSVSEESLSKTLDEFMDMSSQSEVSPSSGISEMCVKSRKEKRNENRLFTIGDDEEEQSEVKTVCDDIKSVSDVFRRTSSVSTLQASIPTGSNHRQQTAFNSSIVVSGKHSLFSTVPKLISEENENGETQKQYSTSTAMSASEHSEACHSSDIPVINTANNGHSFALQKLSVISFVEPEPHRSLAATNNNVGTQLQFPSDEIITRNEVDQQLPEHISQMSHQAEMKLETTHPPQEEPETLQEILSNNNDDNKDDNNSSGNRKPTGNLESHDLEKPQQHSAAYSLGGDNIHIPVVHINKSGITEEFIQSAKTRQLTNKDFSTVQNTVIKCMDTVTSEDIDFIRFRGENIKYEYTSAPGDNVSYIPAKGRKDSKWYASSLMYDMNYFDLFNAGSSDNVDVKRSQRDIEMAVESWLKFYDIRPTAQCRHCECETVQGSKLLEKCRFPQQCKNFIPQPGHSMRCNSLVRARQIWLDFYGIEMVEKSVSGTNRQPNGHLLSVPVEVHGDSRDSYDISVTGEQSDRQTERKTLKHSLLFDPVQVDEVKVGKRLKRVIKYKKEKSYSGCETHSVLGSPVCITGLEDIPENLKQSSDTDGNQPGKPEQESCPVFVPNYSHQGIGCNETRSGGSVVYEESVQNLQPSSFVNQAKVEHDLPTPLSNQHKRIYKSLDDNIAESVHKLLTPQTTEMFLNPDFNLTPAISFSKRQTVHCLEEASILEKTTTEPTSVLSCVFPLENGAGTFECCSREFEDQIEETPNDKEFAVNYLVSGKDKIDMGQFETELKKSSEQRETNFINICSKQFQDQKDFTTQTDKKYLVDIASSSSCKNDIFLLDRAIALDNKPANYPIIKSKSMSSYMLGKHDHEAQGGITSDQPGGTNKAAVTTYQVLESLSITCRALLAELGIYQDILEGIIPLNREMVCQNNMKWMTPCPDCERRQQDKVRKMLGIDLGSAQGRDASAAVGAEAGQTGDTAGNAIFHRVQALTDGAGQTGDTAGNAIFHRVQALTDGAEAGQTGDTAGNAIFHRVQALTDGAEAGQTGDTAGNAILHRVQALTDGAEAGQTGETAGNAIFHRVQALTDGAEAGQTGNTAGNAIFHRVQALTDAQSNNSSALHHLTIDELKSERRSTLGSEASSLSIEMYHELEEPDTTGTSASDSRADFFIKMARRCPDIMRAMSQKCSIEQLKRRDPELCILLSLISIVLLQLICWLPIVILYMVYDVTEFPPTPSCTELVFLWLWCSRMAIQPVLYAFYSQYFHQNYIEIILCKQCR